MRFISFVLLTIFSFLLIILIPLGTVLFSANSTFLKPYQSEQYLEKSGLYGNVKDKLRKELIKVDPDVKQTALQKVQTKLVGEAFDALITDELIASKAGLVQTSLWDYLTNKTETLLGVPITELSKLSTEFPQLKIGENTDLITAIGMKADKLAKVKTNYQLYTKGIWGLYILIFVLLAVCGMLTYILNITGKWIGVSLVIGAAIALMMWAPVLILSETFNFAKESQSFRSGLIGLFKEIRHDFLKCLTITGGVIFVLGIVTTFINRREEEEQDLDQDQHNHPLPPPELPKDSKENNEMITIL